jgi:DNA-binding transcriptional ArsR family regulator
MDEIYSSQAEIFKVLSHPVRLQILELLSQNEACVCQLTPLLEQRQPYVSQQLMLLREIGLVTTRREGSTVFYALSCPHIRELFAEVRLLLACLGKYQTESWKLVPQADLCPCPAWSPEED